ncbi:putative efflux pump antibiotic resistance protein [Rosellinia necatrix]|uniref:Putative efflux pump antibiotic resistance protein n=1 Tax=Rosellinia necatrix TaxID=77044 RepID=A0A1S8A6L9_ROSNE|nr:putative efflux pump antibiotic resistance protein [Rosellinia necatrix]
MINLAIVSYTDLHPSNVPVGVVVVIVVLLFVPTAQPPDKTNENLPIREKLRHMDGVGLLLFLGAVTSLLLVLTWGGQAYPWNDQKIIGLIVGFGLLALAFCAWLVKRGDRALIPLKVLKIRSIYVGSVSLLGFGVLSVVYGYYLPILFQSAQGASITESGLRYIALVGPQIVALLITGAVVSFWGYYVPYMVAGGIICSVGAGLLTTVEVTTSTPRWAAYLVLTGIGLGMGAQLPYTALQAVLSPADVATGNAIAVFSFHLAGAIGTAIGQNLLIRGLYDAVPKYTDAVSAAEVIQAGANGLTHLAASPDVLLALRSAYVEAVRRTIILGLAGVILATLASCFMERVNIKHIAEERKRALKPEDSSSPETKVFDTSM